MKRIICAITALLILAASAYSASALVPQSSRVCQCADDTGAFSVSFTGSHASVKKYSSSAVSADIDLSYSVGAVCAYHGRVVFFCDDPANDQLIVYVYTVDSDILNSFAVYGAKLYANTDFCCDDGAVYLENHRDNRELLSYSYSGALAGRYRMNDEITSVFNGWRGGIYAVSGGCLYTLSKGGFVSVPGASVEPPLFAAGESCIASAYGRVYLLDGGRITRTFSVDRDYRAVSACVVGDRLYYPCGSMVSSYDIATGEKLSRYRFPSDASLIYACGGSIAAANGSTYTEIPVGDFEELFLPEKADSVDDPVSVSGCADTYGISSDVYAVDSERFYITGITPSTTISQFRSNMSYDGYAVEIYRGDTLKSSGYVGTAMTVRFTADSGSVTYELSVDGDLTGEGNCNSLDMNSILDYLIGASSFNGVYSVAADLSGDGAVDAADAAIMKSRI